MFFSGGTPLQVSGVVWHKDKNMAVIVSDDFTRSDSATVGNGWSQNSTGGGANPQIVSNKLRIGDASGNAQGAVYRSLGSQTSVSLSCVFQVVTSVSRPVFIVPYFASSSYNSGSSTGVGLQINTSTGAIDIVDGTTSKKSGSYTFSTSTDYYIWIDIVANGSNLDTSVFISTSSTKPALATLTAVNHTYTNSGNYCALSVDATNAGKWTFDTVSISTGYTLLTNYEGSNDDYENGGTNANRAQSFQFQTNNATISGISLYGSKGSLSSGTFKFVLRSGSASGTEVASTGTITTSNLSSYGSPAWNTMTFTTPYSALKDTTYWLVLICLTGSTSDEVRWSTDTTSPSYSYGSRYYATSGDTGWTQDTTRDYNFAIYGTPVSEDTVKGFFAMMR